MGNENITHAYIGDGVYAVWDGFRIILRANDFDHPTDVIYLEPYVLEELNRFFKRSTGVKQDEDV